MPIIGSFGAGSKGGFGRGGKKIFEIDYLVIAGGGGGGRDLSGGGGAGGFRLSYGATPLSSQEPIELEAGTPYTVTIGAGGNAPQPNTSGSNSEIVGVITATGGGKAYGGLTMASADGGSAGGEKIRRHGRRGGVYPWQQDGGHD